MVLPPYLKQSLLRQVQLPAPASFSHGAPGLPAGAAGLSAASSADAPVLTPDRAPAAPSQLPGSYHKPYTKIPGKNAA